MWFYTPSGRHKKLRDFFVHSDAFRFFVTHQQHNITTHELTRRDWCFYPSPHKAVDKDRRYRYPPLDTQSGKRLKFCGVFPHNVDTMHPSGYPILVSSFVWWCIGTPISWCVCRWWCHGPCWYTLIISRTIWYLANQTPVGVSDTNIHHDIGVPMHHHTKLLTRIGDTDTHHWTYHLKKHHKTSTIFQIVCPVMDICISDPCQQLCVVMHRNSNIVMYVRVVKTRWVLIHADHKSHHMVFGQSDASRCEWYEHTSRYWSSYASPHKAADKDRRYRYPSLDISSEKTPQNINHFPDCVSSDGYLYLRSLSAALCSDA